MNTEINSLLLFAFCTIISAGFVAYIYTIPSNICYSTYTDVKTIGDEWMHKDPDAKTSCQILNCFQEHNYNMTIEQLNLFASCKQTGLIK